MPLPLNSPLKHLQPIPPPSYLRQYRAIGLVYGHYQRAAEPLTQGNLLTPEGTVIEAVVLGRAISLLKNHLDLEQPHLWVVYPRTGKEDERLHLQIVGVWEPHTLQPQETFSPPPHLWPPGYFSVRGEVVGSTPDNCRLAVKIRQAAPSPAQKPKFFKLQLHGCLPEKAVNRFWDLHVQLQADTLIVQGGIDLGILVQKPTRQ